MRRVLLLSCAVVLALTTTGCKLKLSAKVKGFKADSDDTVLVHVTSEEGADIFCEWCGAITKVPAGGETDIEVKIPYDAKTKKLTIKGRKGSRKEGEVMVDFEKELPPKLSVNDYGGLSCEPRKCTGTINLVPDASFFMLDAVPGTQIEIGSDKFTVPTGSDGHITGPLKSIALNPPLQKWALMDVCTGKREDGRVIASAPVTVTFPDGVKVTTTASFKREIIQRDLTAKLGEVSKGPVLFPWEKAGTPATGKRAAVYLGGGVCFDAGHTGATIADLDVIATSQVQERVVECKDRLTGSTTGNTYNVTFKLTMKDAQAAAYDRITGKVLGTKLFQAPRACAADPKMFVSSDKTDVKADDKTTHANEEEIGKWAATFAK